MRKAAECHRQVRKYAQSIIKPGMRLVDICEQIENTNRLLIEANKIEDQQLHNLLHQMQQR
jgi:methionyl aminopeptidase